MTKPKVGTLRHRVGIKRKLKVGESEYGNDVYEETIRERWARVEYSGQSESMGPDQEHHRTKAKVTMRYAEDIAENEVLSHGSRNLNVTGIWPDEYQEYMTLDCEVLDG